MGFFLHSGLGFDATASLAAPSDFRHVATYSIGFPYFFISRRLRKVGGDRDLAGLTAQAFGSETAPPVCFC